MFWLKLGGETASSGMCGESPKVMHPILRKNPIAVALLPLWGAQCSEGYGFLFALARASYSNGSLPQLPRRLIPIAFRPQKAGSCPPTSQNALISRGSSFKFFPAALYITSVATGGYTSAAKRFSD
ncbi:hypothetical protein KIL84_006011 [Mauremys mutica]|uniref:Uncharacterized protein n=1 Tax=Mauremys mutica TaxID=74926 RepID=A0A9D3XI08_9SAUR|nr:hypothetical protein KIL84_006011 [Mauremys mutica]